MIVISGPLKCIKGRMYSGVTADGIVVEVVCVRVRVCELAQQ